MNVSNKLFVWLLRNTFPDPMAAFVLSFEFDKMMLFWLFLDGIVWLKVFEMKIIISVLSVRN